MAGQALPSNTGTLALVVGQRQPGTWPWASQSAGWKGSLFSRAEGEGVECPLPESVLSQELRGAEAEGQRSLASRLSSPGRRGRAGRCP